MLPKAFFWSVVAATISAVAAQSDDGAVIGIPVDSDAESVPIRKNINTIYAEKGPEWDLYIQALKAMQNRNSTDILSYWQVMGVHGKPYQEWNDGGSGNVAVGYCPHGERLFLSWHRPYVSLYEQILVGHAKRIAAEYPQGSRNEYIEAAENLRAPYWDWGLDTIPRATVPAMVVINVPDGSSVTEKHVYNPLATYNFPDVATNDPDFDPENRDKIYRCPNPNTYPDTANANLRDRPYKRWIHDCFTNAKNFLDFASTGDSGISLEQIHNGIHWDAACEGQFLANDFTAFDPLFMLHHTNVDRLWAYWQYISPEYDIFKGGYSGNARYASPEGTTINVDSPLHPFRDGNGNYHTTKSVRSIEDFGYSYQALEYWSKTPAEMARDAKSLINRLYGSESLTLGARPDKSGNVKRYFANIEIDVAEVERPCAVQLYIEDQKADEIVIMEHPMKGISHQGFSIDEALDATGILDDSPDDVLESIKSSVEVAIVNVHGDRMPLPDKGLKIVIEEADVEMQKTDDSFPSVKPKKSVTVEPSEQN